ncbi:hypothetical protein J3R82DRAFT_1499 [Butyriboletus roseoflavus]|nr:hypothetical protein J3R82DRAFT_1499 [Butyriboletus roseoflavus]
MADTNRDGISTLYRGLAAQTNLDFNNTTNKPAGQKRTRSQFNVPDLRLPHSRSPLKAARTALAKARGTSPMLQADSQLRTSGASQSSTVDRGEAVARSSVVTEAGTQEAVHREGQEEEMDTCADGRARKYEKGEGTEDSLFSPASHGGKVYKEDSNSSQSQHTMWPTSTKKRVSPDTDALRTPLTPGGQRQSKRAKLEAYRILGRGQEHSEYHEPLRDPDTTTPARLKGYKRASSTKPTPSPSRVVSSIFPPRAQSVPPDEEKGVHAIDLTTIPPSPRRSPSKDGVEIRRAPSIPPPDNDRMDVDPGDTSALLQFTNATQHPTPQANPVFCYTVNFATPRRSATPFRCGFPSASPLSPLTPLPSSPFAEHLPEMQSLLAKKANPRLLALRNNMNNGTDTPTGSMVIPSVADTTASTDVFQPTTHVSSRPSSAASTSRPASVARASFPASQSDLGRLPLTPSNSTGLMPPPTASEKENGSVTVVTVARGSDQAMDVSSNNSGGTGTVSTAVASVDLSSALSPRPDSNAMPISRPTMIGAMRPKRGPSVPQGPRRVTRSVSMKEQRVKRERVEAEDTTVSSCTVEAPDATTSIVAGPSSEVVAMPPPSTISKPRPPQSTGAVTSNSRPLSMAHRSASVSKILPDPNKLKQTSLNVFIKGKPSAVPAAAGSSTTFTSTSTGSSSRVVPSSSLSKLPVLASPLKRPSTSQARNTQPFPFALGSAGTGVGTGTPRETSGRSLTTLSHALDKLIVPPPSRPNTSMGFVTTEGPNEESTPENSKGKGKAKDDTSLPLASTAQGSGTTFARPTASSLKRAATMMGFGSTTATRMRGRGGATVGGFGRGRGAIGIFGKAGDRASKKTTLPVVVGSPVKGSEGVDGWGAGKHKSRLSLGDAKGAGGVTGEEDVFVSQDAVTQDYQGGYAASQKLHPTAANASNGIEIDLTTSPISADKGKQRAVPSSTLNPASSALHALSESLSSLPQTPTPPKPRMLGTRTGLRSSSAATGKESPALDGSGSVAPGGNNEVHGSGGAGPSNGTVNGSGGVKKSSLKILKRCAIFVDVRTEQGDDAGSLFVDMLKGLGAKIMGRLGQTCTHIVYKNGHPNTLTRYRMLNDPKPVVVGIAWVVECAEKRARVDEERFKVDVDVINVASGNNKRRRIMFPKHFIPISPGPSDDMPLHVSSEADDDEEGAGGIDGSPSQDPDTSIRSREDDLPPLERARRRRSILPGGQTRLVP